MKKVYDVNIKVYFKDDLLGTDERSIMLSSKKAYVALIYQYRKRLEAAGYMLSGAVGSEKMWILDQANKERCGIIHTDIKDMADYGDYTTFFSSDITPFFSGVFKDKADAIADLKATAKDCNGIECTIDTLKGTLTTDECSISIFQITD